RCRKEPPVEETRAGRTRIVTVSSASMVLRRTARTLGTVPNASSCSVFGRCEAPVDRHGHCAYSRSYENALMPRGCRIIEPCTVQHVINRGNARQQVFRDPEDYEEFVDLLGLVAKRVDVPLLAYCLMPNHWHLVLWPARSRDLFCYMHWLTSTHVRRTH